MDGVAISRNPRRDTRRLDFGRRGDRVQGKGIDVRLGVFRQLLTIVELDMVSQLAEHSIAGVQQSGRSAGGCCEYAGCRFALFCKQRGRGNRLRLLLVDFLVFAAAICDGLWLAGQGSGD